MYIVPVNITITTSVPQIKNTASALDSISEDDEILDEFAADEEEALFLHSSGILMKEDGCIKLIYKENSKNGGGETDVMFVFREESPHIVSMVKGGELTTSLVFNSENTRNICLHGPRMFPFEVVVCTEELENTISMRDGGRLTIAYSVEFKGIMADYNKLSIKVVPALNMKREEI